MSVRAWLAGVALGGLVAVGTLLDYAYQPAPGSPDILEADLHVHPFPGDGVLSVTALRREAERRGLHLIGITAHNNRLALDLARVLPDGRRNEVIVLPGQEITSPNFHIAAVGVTRTIDWRLGAADAVAAVHAQGGVAIAAHPVLVSWRDPDPSALALLDGVEVAHPGRLESAPGRDEYLEFFRRVQGMNPGVAPIGSSDFHAAAPLGLCRTYLLVKERSAAGALEAIRAGRTVARGARGELHGAAADVAAVEQYLEGRNAMPMTPLAERLVALAALAALATLAAPPLRRGGR